jgi:hypothetical protein
VPIVVAGQADVVPPQRRDVAEQRIIHGTALPKGIYGPLEVHRIPERDGGDHQIQTAGAISLILIGAIPNLAQPMEEHRTREGIPSLSLVQSASDTTPQRWIAKPLNSTWSDLTI